MSDLSFDFKWLLDATMESTLLKNKQLRPIVILLKKYNITGLQAVSFLAEFATVCQQLPKKEDSE